ncbi:hypothetical protein B0H17DRAFT_1139582 [Mycena rosella]|uniref:Uncharacterized protein n=1 Tax=Mycena rosella TaxID=1033263 RepID=A0AAD7D487_MYCRO|nr:hypothetical protein B0H17DRAFT_1139582 [Mycena rosella]
MFKARLQALSPPGRALGLPGRAGPGSGPEQAQGPGFNILKPEPGPEARAWGADQIRNRSDNTPDIKCDTLLLPPSRCRDRTPLNLNLCLYPYSKAEPANILTDPLNGKSDVPEALVDDEDEVGVDTEDGDSDNGMFSLTMIWTNMIYLLT